MTIRTGLAPRASRLPTVRQKQRSRLGFATTRCLNFRAQVIGDLYSLRFADLFQEAPEIIRESRGATISRRTFVYDPATHQPDALNQPRLLRYCLTRRIYDCFDDETKSAPHVPWWVHTLRGLDIQLCGSRWHRRKS
jgi:hypothetical protein